MVVHSCLHVQSTIFVSWYVCLIFHFFGYNGVVNRYPIYYIFALLVSYGKRGWKVFDTYETRTTEVV